MYKKKVRGIAVVLMLFILCLFFVDSKIQAKNYESEYVEVIYNNANGLESAEANAVVQTEDGYIWVGTYAGLFRYDGSSFQKMGEKAGIVNVTALYVDTKGVLWIGTNDSGLVKYVNHSFTSYTKDNGISSESIRVINEDSKGTIYIGTTGCLYTISPKGKVTQLKGIKNSNYVSSLAVGAQDVIAGATNSGNLFFVKDGKQIPFEEPEVLGDTFYQCVYYLGNNSYLAGTSENKMITFYVAGNHMISGAQYNTGELYGISYIFKDDSNVIWMCSNTGIGYMDEKETIHLKLDDFNSSVENMTQDYEGNFWFTSSRQGLLKLTENQFKNTFVAAGINEEAVVNAVYIKDHILYAGTDTGLILINLYTNQIIENELTKRLKGIRIRCINEDSAGNLWFSTYGDEGLLCEKKDSSIITYNATTPGMAGSRARSTLELNDGTIAVALSTGINFIKDDKVGGKLDETNGLTNPQILTMVENEKKDSVYAGSDGDGIFVIKNQKIDHVINIENGLPSQIILRMIPFKKGYLVVTSNSLCYMDEKENIHILKEFPYSNNFDVVLEGKNNVYILSSAGIYLVNGDELLADKEYRYQLFNSKQGLSSSLTANSWNYVTKDNVLYLACASGVRSVDLDALNKKSTEYKLAINQVSNGTDTEFALCKGKYLIPEDCKRVTISPAVLNYTLDDPYVSYYLEGFDEKPIVVRQSELRKVNYTNLAYGDYEFHLSILEENTLKKIDSISVKITRKAQFYEHHWFYAYLLIICIFMVVFVTWVLAKVGSIAVIKAQYQTIQEAKNEADRANETKSVFLANMSHEIRTPINTVLGMDEMILREAKEQGIIEYATNIQLAGQGLLSLINDILDFSKIESGKMEIVPVEYSLEAQLQNLYHMIFSKAQEKGLAFIIDVQKEIPNKLYGDEVRIRQVVLNLLTNSVKYTKEGFIKLIVQYERVESRQILLTVCVEDSGIGIKEEEISTLFDSFSRADERRNRNIEGTGLGLNIAYQMVAMMGGELKVESEYGKGSRFSFQILQAVVSDMPMRKFVPGYDTSQRSLDCVSHKFFAPKANILVVDDNEMNLKVVEGLLKQTRMQVDTALSGKQCILMVTKKRYNIILMDHMMPGLDGVETLMELKKNESYIKDTVVIALTANAISGAREEYIKKGFDDYITKPVNGATLERILQQYLPEELIEKKEDMERDEEPVKKVPQNNQYEWKLPLLRLQLEAGIDIREAMNYSMDKEAGVFENIKILCGNGDQGVKKLRELYEKRDYKNYTIQVHALKSNLAMVGNVTLSNMAFELEKAGKEERYDVIKEKAKAFEYEYDMFYKTVSSVLNR